MIFRFKQFELDQTDCAMKVGTDGVLLGAWCSTSEGKALDIGTGTGLIALMMAQRNKALQIDAIELDQPASARASSNFKISKWSDRLNCLQGDVLNTSFSSKYDLIVCNPPFFVNSTKAASIERTKARHTDSLDFNQLLWKILSLLNVGGKFSIILPISEGELFIGMSENEGLYLNRLCKVYPNPDKPVKRLLMEFGTRKEKLFEESIVIEESERHNYSKDYITLTKDFYLKF